MMIIVACLLMEKKSLSLEPVIKCNVTTQFCLLAYQMDLVLLSLEMYL